MHLRRAVPSPPLLKDAPSFGRPVVPTSSPSPSSCPLCRPTRAARLHRSPPLGLLRCLLPPLCPRATVSPPVALVRSPQWACAAHSPSQAIPASHAPDRTRCRRHLRPKAHSSPSDVIASPSDVIAYLLLVPETRKASLRGRAVRPLGVATAVSRWTVAVAPSQSVWAAVTKVPPAGRLKQLISHRPRGREVQGQGAGWLGPPLTCFCPYLFPTCSLFHGQNGLFRT